MRNEHLASAAHATRITGKGDNLSTSNLLLEFPILGINTRFETNEQNLATAVGAVYNHWVDLCAYPELCSTQSSLRVRLALHSAATCSAATTRVRVSEPHRLFLKSTALRASADSQRGIAHAVLGPALLQDRELLRTDVLDALTLFLITARDRTPIHASAIADADVALALSGPSGVGKSTLAHIAAKNGYQVLSDDAVYVQLDPVPRVWGVPRAPRPRAAGAALREPKPVQPEIESRLMPPVREWSGLCMLRRGTSSKGALVPLSFDQAAQHLLATLDPGFDRFRAGLVARIKTLTQGGAWQLELPNAPEAALPFLAEMMSAVRARRPA